MARRFITTALESVGRPVDVFASSATCRAALDALAKHLGLFKEDNKQKGDAIAALLITAVNIVGGIVIAMYLPIFKLAGNIQGG